jgi:cytochrome P450
MTTAYASPVAFPSRTKLPGRLPLLGHLLEFRKDLVGLLLRVSDQPEGLVEVQVGVVDFLIATSPRVAHEVLVEEEAAFMKSAGLHIFARPLLGDGLLTSEREVHRRQRRMLAPVFAHKRIASYGDVMVKKTEESATRLLGAKQAVLGDEMMRLTLEIVGKTLFDAELGGDATLVGEALTESMRRMMDGLVRFIPTPPFVPTLGNLRFRRAVRTLDELVYRIIAERRRASGVDRGDMLGMLLATKDADDGSGLTDREVRDQAMTILLAGHETTANTLAWTFYLLGKRPEVRARVEAEVDAALGGRTATVEDLPKLPYSLSVLKEAMRLYPPAYMIGRRATRDVTIGGTTVKKGQIVLLNVLGIHRRASVFPNPAGFDPDRFAGEREKKLPPLAYMPFGAGPRVCIGNHFAMMEGHLVLATLAQRLRFELQGGGDATAEPLVTLRPKGGLPVRVVPR